MAGEKITYSATTSGDTNAPSDPFNGSGFALYGDNGNTVILEQYGAAGAELNLSGNYVLPANDTQFIVYIWSNPPGSSQATVTCSAQPTVTAISPTSGSLGGGNSVVITGTNFTGTTGAGGVKFGSTNAASYTVNSDAQITAVAPTGSAGTVNVTVTTTGGTSATSAADQYTYVAGPTVTSISPTAGPQGGGTTVIITGSNLSGATAVTFGATAATGFTVDSATQITATSPSGIGTIDVKVTTAGGTSATSAADQFTYVGAPTVSSISPTSGPGTGGTTVTITGTNFSGATAVTFGATAATGFTVVSATTITATSPSGTGTVDVRVTSVGGTSATSAADQFTYIPSPTVTSISPTAGPTAGGTTVTITGTNFTGVTAVTFGASAASFTFNSATSITATAPSGTGTVDVRVTTTGGTSATSAADQYTYVAGPTVTSISPTSGPQTGGTTVIITGSGFSGATVVTFGGTAATSFTVNSATSISAVAPAGSGTVDIQVTTVGGTSTTSAADQFTYAAAPTVAAVAPTAGPVAGGTSVAITGTGFTAATAVTFGVTAATSYTVNSATSITAVSPAGAGTVDIRVTNPGGTSATSAADQFTYTAAPTVTTISPASGPAPGGTTVTIAGSGFTGATGVTFGATAATSFTVNSATSITATAPAGTGVVDITVTTVGGTSATTAADQFSYLGAPVVTSISPTTGPAVGGTSVTITGSDFAGTAGAGAVRFGAANAASYTVNSANSITAVSPPGTGTVDIVVTTNSQTSAVTSGDRFTYQSATTQTTLASSQNPSQFGQPVTFTATVAATGGTPAGTVTFADGGLTIGSATLSGGLATFSTSTLAIGSHTITASYGGSTTFAPSTSPSLAQTVDVPIDSVRLRALQINVTKVVAQASGQAISGAIDDAIADSFNEDAAFMTPGNGHIRFNFFADPSDDVQAGPTASAPGIASSAFGADGRGNAFAEAPGSGSRVEDAFAAINQQMPEKAPPKFEQTKQWLLWADVRTSGIDRWNTTNNNGLPQTSESSLYGQQVNALMGLTYKPRPNLAIGVVGGWETFSYTDQDIDGKLKGDGWTAGAYLGWKILPTLRYDAAVTYSGIGYNGVAGIAQGNFTGERWMLSSGLTGSYKTAGFLIEPSAKVYALWEHENGYVDSLGTQQGSYDFMTGRASGGVKAAYPLPWADSGIVLTPFAGLYGDYYFNTEDSGAILGADGLPQASTTRLQGWSARATGGLAARFPGGAGVAIGGELGGLGSNTKTWTLSAKAQVPF
ncbi:IPT/TIG domain-containing protein [Mesorhizobium erdmanii]|uniref:IPT/TIG domain-containing protein n=1 Tax=Mesorhizobium erdmanii TaxID=1777866 RepID=UPI001FD7C8C0|nr:IPT/TIG domain-containing protein [Mesorhizobium erdmanii]